jgi:two-component system response regulator FixJ
MIEEERGRAIYVIDDDREVRVSLRFQLSTLGYAAEPFAEAADFLDRLATLRPGVILLDVRMPRIDGMDVLAELGRREVDWPVIVMTGHADVPIAVTAMKRGAVEFLEKPFEEDVLIEALTRSFALLDERTLAIAERGAIAAKLGRLSPREREVLRLVAAGEPNKLIAHALDLSVRTVEMHRANLMTKLGVRSAAEAVAYAVQLA